MAFKHKERALEAVIPTASMADIAFLLIIFFMVTTQFQLDRTAVALPKSEFRNEVPKGSAYVVLHREGGMTDMLYKFSNGEDMSTSVDFGTLEIQVNTVTSIDPTTPFVIKAPGDAEYRYVDEVIELVQRAGAEEVILLTEQTTVEGGTEGGAP
jgi:biopolymer transport protein ExbD